MRARLEIRTGRGDASLTQYVASRGARAVRAKYRLAGLTKAMLYIDFDARPGPCAARLKIRTVASLIAYCA